MMSPIPQAEDKKTERLWLASLIGNSGADWPASCSMTPWSICIQARTEGVASLAYERLSGQDDACPRPVRDLLASAAREDALWSLRLEAEIRQVLSALAGSGLRALLLKGSALAWWLYPSPRLRECVDIDLLLETREQAERAARAIAALGYEQREAPSGDLTTFELTYVRRQPEPGVEVDLHWEVGGAPMFADRLSVAELFASAQPLPRISPHARGPDPVHALLHAAMHRALNLHLVGDKLKWLYDLHLLASHFSGSEWQRLLILASKRGLAGTALSALRASQAAFGHALPEESMRRLAEQAQEEAIDPDRMSQWSYIQWMNLRALPDTRTRLRWLRERMLPSSAYLREIYGSSGVPGWYRYIRRGLGKLLGGQLRP